MSIALDFSDMFRQAPKEQSSTPEQPPPVSPMSMAVDNDENAAPFLADSSTDLHLWVKTSLRSLNLSLKDEDLTTGSLPIWQRLITERLQWQNQSQAVVEENISMRRKFENLDREKTTLKATVEGLQQEVRGVQGKMGAMAEDQRQLRNHWLAEKNELETKFFQAQGQVTQFQGSIRKKDKDYEKLQNQLAKFVKDSQRGQKSVSLITKPLPKNFQETVKTMATLKDVELADARAMNTAIEAENNNLRNMFNTLTSSFEEVQRKLTMSNITAMMQQQSPEPLQEHVGTSPMREEICSPISRPYQHIVRQAASCAKEATLLSMSPLGPGRGVPQSEEQDSTKVQELQNALNEISRKLQNAQAVIAEQDSLIHAALIGKLPGLPEYIDVAENECDSTFDDIKIEDCLKEVSPEDQVFHIRDFISPASPATMELLGSAGAFWSPVVPQSHAKKSTFPRSEKKA